MAATIHTGDALEVLRTLGDESVHCCVTSPPYWNLRDYGVAGQIGLEATLAEWVERLVAVFAEVHRVLRRDGTLWLNVGDAYVTHPPGRTSLRTSTLSNPTRQHRVQTTQRGDAGGLARKQRMGLPHRLVFALQAAGWWWRDEIVWGKRSPMPESTRDRSTMAHEFLFLFTKRPTYFFDQEGWKEPVAVAAAGRGDGRTPRGWDTGPGDHLQKRGRYEPRQERTEAFGRAPGWRAGQQPATRNRRSVWTLTSEPFRGAHFATFPTALIEPCIVAGTSSAGCCTTCGRPLERTVRKGAANLAHQRACGGDATGTYDGKATKDYASARAEDASAVKARILAGLCERETVGWRKRCKCAGDDVDGCTVLDPFAGSGTTGVVAVRHRRHFVGIELNPEHAAMARQRIGAEVPLLFSRAAATPDTPEPRQEASTG